jgi:hypothetical protein
MKYLWLFISGFIVLIIGLFIWLSGFNATAMNPVLYNVDLGAEDSVQFVMSGPGFNQYIIHRADERLDEMIICLNINNSKCFNNTLYQFDQEIKSLLPNYEINVLPGFFDKIDFIKDNYNRDTINKSLFVQS